MSWVRGHFDLPATPDGTQMPQAAQFVATLSMGVLVAGFAVYAIREIARRRSVTLGVCGDLMHLQRAGFPPEQMTRHPEQEDAPGSAAGPR